MGVDFHTRGRRADEAIDVFACCGPVARKDNLCSFPKPLGVTELPIHVGGSSRAAASLAGRRGNGYFAGGMLPEHERDIQIDLARRTAPAAGRNPVAVEYTRWGSIDMSANASRSSPGEA
jgi:alkanesulfonate monooxygenase SsuD/methylene tetrahydromethanopterin reductase-like flavin-dependent oxidoreductase (luciferase family)